MFPLHDSLPSHKTPIITWILIALNVALFLMELSRGEAFIAQYALTPASISSNVASWYPFFTSMFLHGGWFHMLSNMWFLWIFGDNVEAALGRFRYLLFFLASGIIAALAQYSADATSAIPMLGASGAIAGVLGAYFIFFRHATITSFVFLGFYITVIDIPAVVYLPYWFLLQLFSGVGQIGQAATGGVAFLAHAGGFIAGVIGALLLQPAKKEPTDIYQ